MNVKRFTARNSREALGLVRLALGEDAVVLSTRPSPEGIEVLAMAPDGVEQIERAAAQAETFDAQKAALRAKTEAARASRAAPERRAAPRPALPPAQDVDQDVEQLAMSTLSFQDYVRERMLKRRQAALNEEQRTDPRGESRDEPRARSAPKAPTERSDRRAEPWLDAAPEPRRSGAAAQAAAPAPAPAYSSISAPISAPASASAYARAATTPPAVEPAPARARSGAPAPRAGRPEAMRDAFEPELAPELPTLAEPASAHRDALDMVSELRSMKGLIEERFGALAFMDKLQRQPRQALLAQRLMDCGFSPALIRKLVDALPDNCGDEAAWAANVLERNLLTDEAAPALEEQGGVYALIGSTGVGKTTSTAKIAAAFATRHGAAHLGLITLDAYRVAAHEQLRTYGRILGVPVHTAHDRASLEDLLDLLSAKKMVLIDTAGMAQRDSRARELLDMLSHRSIHRLLVIDAASQGETTEDVITSWRATQCKGIVLSKIDEAVKLAPALDAVIRHKLKVVGVANGQRVPEDWHRLSANALVHRAMRGTSSAAYRFEPADVQLVFATAHQAMAPHLPTPSRGAFAAASPAA